MSDLAKISLDWAFVFDLLAIVTVKIENLENGAKRDSVLKSSEKLWDEIENQLGKNKAFLICGSDEYQDLLEINRKVWDAVDLAERDEIRAKEVADLNTSRYSYKKKLQEKFFNNPLSEQKARETS